MYIYKPMVQSAYNPHTKDQTVKIWSIITPVSVWSLFVKPVQRWEINIINCLHFVTRTDYSTRPY